MNTVSTSIAKHAAVLVAVLFCMPVARSMAQSSGLPTVRSQSEAGGGRVGHAIQAPVTLGAASAPLDVIYFAPSVLLDPHQRDYHLQIGLRNPNARPVCDPSQLKITLQFDPTLFAPKSVTNGTIESRSTLAANQHVITISFVGTSPISDGIITEVIGDILVGSEQSAPLVLGVTCGGAAVTDSVESGHLYLGPGFCEEGSDRLLVYTQGLKINRIAPNPSRGALTVSVTTMELAEAHLEVYAMNGDRVFHTSWIPASAHDEDMRREILLPSELASGEYRLLLRTDARRHALPLIIAK